MTTKRDNRPDYKKPYSPTGYLHCRYCGRRNIKVKNAALIDPPSKTCRCRKCNSAELE